MAPTELVDESGARRRVDELLAAEESFALLAARVDLPDEVAADAEDPITVVSGRLGLLVRGVDVLAFVPPATFVLIGEGLDAAGARLVAERMKEAFHMPLEVQGRVVSLVVDQSSVVVQPVEPITGAPALVDRRSAADGDAWSPEDGEAALRELLARLERS
ncbi:MAG: hypothetical protein ACKOYM_10220 [Actinomycetes bacterium]